MRGLSCSCEVTVLFLRGIVKGLQINLTPTLGATTSFQLQHQKIAHKLNGPYQLKLKLPTK